MLFYLRVYYYLQNVLDSFWLQLTSRIDFHGMDVFYCSNLKFKVELMNGIKANEMKH